MQLVSMLCISTSLSFLKSFLFLSTYQQHQVLLTLKNAILPLPAWVGVYST